MEGMEDTAEEEAVDLAAVIGVDLEAGIRDSSMEEEGTQVVGGEVAHRRLRGRVVGWGMSDSEVVLY